MTSTIIAIVLVVIVFFAIRSIVHKIKFGGGCCGTHDAPAKKIKIKDKNKSHYPFTYTLLIDGMTCSVCARRVENALNALGDTWAAVNLSKNSASVLSKKEVSDDTFRTVIRETGYTVLSIK